MKIEAEKKQRMLNDLKAIQKKMTLLITDSNLESVAELNRLNDLIDTCNKVTSQFKASILNQPKINLETTPQAAMQTASILPRPSSNEIAELINLFSDLFQGKENDFLQEVLANAELYIKVHPQDEDDPNSRKVLTINIQLAATVIDKYAHLLAVILGKGQKNLLKNHQALFLNAYNNVIEADKRLEELQRARFVIGLKYMLAEAEDYINRHDGRACCFGLFKKKPTKQYIALLDWFAQLSQQPLSASELAGAIYFICNQISQIKLTGEYEAIRDSLNKLLKENNYPSYSKKDPEQLVTKCTQYFTMRAEILALNFFYLNKTDEYKVTLPMSQ